MNQSFSVIIVGGGPAGASAAIHLAALGIENVLLIEAKRFPRQKVCGEFISPECLEHFARLGVQAEMFEASDARITNTIFYSSHGRSLRFPSAWFGGDYALGLSRAEMDAKLLERARAMGVHVVEEAYCANLLIEENQVCGVRVKIKGETQIFAARVTVDATGRVRALARHVENEADIDNAKSRNLASRKSRRPALVAFKAHFENAKMEAGTCEIYFYKGGYGGLSAVENEFANLCFIVRARDVRACESNPVRVMREIVMKNSRAAQTLESARAVSPWLSVALEGFGKNEIAPAQGLIAVGDAASFIDPFTGSGMLMALEGGQLAGECITRFLNEDKSRTLATLASEYSARYGEKFGARLRSCAALRRAAFMPSAIIEAGVGALNLSARMRRRVAGATRATHYKRFAS
jgi:menaquinone-9 beta-reductase